MFFVSRWPRRWRGLTSQALDRFAFSRVQMDIFASSKLLQSSDIRWIFKWAALATSTSTKYTPKPTCSSATSRVKLSLLGKGNACLQSAMNAQTEGKQAQTCANCDCGDVCLLPDEAWHQCGLMWSPGFQRLDFTTLTWELATGSQMWSSPKHTNAYYYESRIVSLKSNILW